ncbi:MAG TPA: hypothetical protein VM848_04655 [Acidimicrobiia bacterium]|nr:hypothetical protein [Acidimicrobiia bacterium]
MKLEEIAEAADRLSLEDPDWGLVAAGLGDALEAELAGPGVMERVARGIASSAERMGCSYLVGASPTGDRIAAVASVLSGNGLGYLTGSPPLEGSIGIVEGFVATGWGIRYKAEQLRRLGATEVIAFIIASGGSADLHDVVDEIVVS